MQLKKNAVVRAKIKKNAVNGSKVADGSLRGADIKETSLATVPSADSATVVSDTEIAIKELARLKDLNVQIALDDFGTGFSSLNYLTQFPIDIIKIDRSFVSALGEDSARSRLSKAFIKLGQSLSLRTLAEGIEDTSQLDSLHALGCELGQGFYFAKPLSAPQLESLFDRNEQSISDCRMNLWDAVRNPRQNDILVQSHLAAGSVPVAPAS